MVLNPRKAVSFTATAFQERSANLLPKERIEHFVLQYNRAGETRGRLFLSGRTHGDLSGVSLAISGLRVLH